MKKYGALFLCIALTCSVAFVGGDKWKRHKRKVLSHQKSIPGWCSIEKANRLMNLIYDIRPKICVEIGVFGGSSIYPMASSLKFLEEGVIYAIDPWSNEECIKGYEIDDPNYGWWNEVNLEKTYLDFLTMLKRYHISKYCIPMKMTSKQALSTFKDGSIDILHIDGSHVADIVMEDAKMYLPKVKKGGYIWFDDVHWVTKDHEEGSTIHALNWLLQYCDKDKRSLRDCYLLRKR